MSKIIYKPHCEKCGSAIEQNVQFKRFIVETNNSIHYRVYDLTNYEFNPYQCGVCGAIFDSAEIRLPEEVEHFESEEETE